MFEALLKISHIMFAWRNKKNIHTFWLEKFPFWSYVEADIYLTCNKDFDDKFIISCPHKQTKESNKFCKERLLFAKVVTSLKYFFILSLLK